MYILINKLTPGGKLGKDYTGILSTISLKLSVNLKLFQLKSLFLKINNN